MQITIDHRKELNLAEILAVSEQGAEVGLHSATRAMLAERRRHIEEIIAGQDLPAYGFNRGFGHNVDLAVKSELLADLQENLIVSHAVGVGESLPVAVVRAAMLLRANSLARGYSGIRPELVEALVDLLNAGITPVVPSLGSVGASGDLAPLSHIALTLIGMGQAEVGGERLPAAEALQRAGLAPLRLAMKEGLALNNGVQVMNAIGLIACARLQDLLKTAAVNSALTAQVMLAPDTYFRPDFHAVRPHPGARRVADWIWKLMQDSPIRMAHRDFKDDGQVQDPYNIRCAAQILGTAHDLITQAGKTLLIEANSATDNPILLPDAAGRFVDVVSGGHFHGMPVAAQIYGLVQAAGIIAGLAHQRTVRYVDPNRNKGLGRDLKWPGLGGDERSISSGLMMLEYASASLLNALWGEAMPSHLFTIATNAGQEDHVSMGTGLAVRLLGSLEKVGRILAIELACTLQAIAVRKVLTAIPTEAVLPAWVEEELAALKVRMESHGDGLVFELGVVRDLPLTVEQRRLSPVSEKLYAALLEDGAFPTVTRDRYMAEELAALADRVMSGRVVGIVEKDVPLPW
jgi:histidine ammonia-lyase